MDHLEPIDPESVVREIKGRLYGPGINSTNRAEEMLRELVQVDDPVIALTVFHDVWSICDDTWRLRDVILEWLHDWTDLLSDGHPCDFLKGKNLAWYSSLPERFTVYRGCSRDRVLGLSWTTDRSVAAGFARGHRGIAVPEPVIASAKVFKWRIFSASNSRRECEVVLDPFMLPRVTIRDASYRRKLGEIDPAKDLAG